jgi:hypothetical protein
LENFHVVDLIKRDPLLTSGYGSLRIVDGDDSSDEGVQQEDVSPGSAAGIEDHVRGFRLDEAEQFIIGKALDFRVTLPCPTIDLVIRSGRPVLIVPVFLPTRTCGHSGSGLVITTMLGVLEVDWEKNALAKEITVKRAK